MSENALKYELHCYHPGYTFPGGSVVKNPPVSAGDAEDEGSISGSGRSPGGGHSNLLQCSCLGNPVVRGTWQATVHRVTKSQTLLKQLSTIIFQGCNIVSYAFGETLPSSLLF